MPVSRAMTSAITRTLRADTRLADPSRRSPDRGLRGTPSSGGRPRPRCGNSRVVARRWLLFPPTSPLGPYLPLVGRSACVASRVGGFLPKAPSPHPARPSAEPPSPSRGGMELVAQHESSHHSGAMRSGPSAFTTRRVTRRQVKRAGGPSGISASTSTGSGSARSRQGRGGLAEAWLGPWRCTGKRRSRLLRPLRDMALAGKEPAHGGSAQAARQAVDQRLLPASVLALGEGGLGRKQRLGRERCEHHEIDAEADIDGFDPIREEAREMRRLAAWRAQAGVDDGGGAVGAIDRKLKAPRAAAGKAERLAKLFRKMIEAGDDAFMGNQRLGEGKPRRVVWRGKEGADAAPRAAQAPGRGDGARLRPLGANGTAARAKCAADRKAGRCASGRGA